MGTITRLEILRYYKKYGLKAACERHGVSGRLIMYWQKILKEKGEEALRKAYRKRGVANLRYILGHAGKFLVEANYNFPEAYKKLALWCVQHDLPLPTPGKVYRLVPRLRKENGRDADTMQKRRIIRYPLTKEVEDYLCELVVETNCNFTDAYRDLALWCAQRDLPLPTPNKVHMLFTKLEKIRQAREMQGESVEEEKDFADKRKRRRRLIFHGSPVLSERPVINC